MCVVRYWRRIDIIQNENFLPFYIKGIRSDGISFQIPVLFDKDLVSQYTSHSRCIDKMQEIIDSIKKLETYRNCQCPNNKECHQIINSELKVLVAHKE
jgi:hypothetical protein